jgi:hypothetical protein
MAVAGQVCRVRVGRAGKPGRHKVGSRQDALPATASTTSARPRGVHRGTRQRGVDRQCARLQAAPTRLSARTHRLARLRGRTQQRRPRKRSHAGTWRPLQRHSNNRLVESCRGSAPDLSANALTAARAPAGSARTSPAGAQTPLWRTPSPSVVNGPDDGPIAPRAMNVASFSRGRVWDRSTVDRSR